MFVETLRRLFPGIDTLEDCIVVDDGKGPYIAKWNRQEKQPTKEEIEALFPAVAEAIRLEELANKQAKEQQDAGIVAAKSAYARLQTIIEGVDTATIVQLRAAIKILARDMQHLIRATIK